LVDHTGLQYRWGSLWEFYRQRYGQVESTEIGPAAGSNENENSGAHNFANDAPAHVWLRQPASAAITISSANGKTGSAKA
jgi:hypothetical protein